MPYCLYLRKSRADIDAEANGEMETLARHEKILLDLAKRMHLDVTEIYREVVSGETISSRPVVPVSYTHLTPANFVIVSVATIISSEYLTGPICS